MKYVFDENNNRFEGMTKEEILESIGAGGERTCVLTGCVTYNNLEINYNYTGSLPDETKIVKLLSCGVDPTNNKLTEAEVENYLTLNNFSIHFYYVDNEIYVTNANRGYLSFTKMGEGTFNVYPRKVEKFYFVKANEKTTSGEYVVETAVNATNAKKADHATNATNAEYAENATIAQYASEDTSKGTIEERLTALGFKEGSITINTSVFNATETKLYRQGNYVIGEITGQFVANANNGNLIFTLPTNFIPTKTIIIGSVANSSGDTYSAQSSTIFAIKNDYKSNGELNNFYLVGYEAPLGIKYHTHTLQFGFEVEALS